MRKFVIRGSLFSLPVVIYVALLVLIDPYNYFASSSLLVRNDVKRATSYRLNYAIWKCVLYHRKFCPSILCGDSRVEPFDEDLMSEVAGTPYRNLALGGGSLPETCSMVEFAVQEAERTHRRLENIYIGLNFSRFHFTPGPNRVEDAIPLLGNPLLYLSNRNVANAAWMNVTVQYFGASDQFARFTMSREAVWQSQLGEPMERSLKPYIYPTDCYKRLETIAEYCRKHQITLGFVIIPTHVDLQNRVADFGLLPMQERFLKDLARLGTVYDFDYPNDLTTNREDYSDPFHAYPHILAAATREVWGDPAARRYVRIYPAPDEGPPPRAAD